jgi:hypothetical protein
MWIQHKPCAQATNIRIKILTCAYKKFGLKHTNFKFETHEMKMCITHMWEYSENFDKELNNVVTFKWNYIVVTCWVFKLKGDTNKKK